MAVLGVELDFKRFTLQVLGGIIGGWLSETVVQRPEIFGIFGEYATPVAGTIVSLLGQYLQEKKVLPTEIAQLLEYGGAFTTGNWIYEQIKTGFGKPQGTRAETVYIPPTEIKKPSEAIVA